MTLVRRFYWLLFILGLSLLLLQSCRQEEQAAQSTAETISTNTPAPVSSAVNSPITSVPPATPLPVPVTASPATIPTPISTVIPSVNNGQMIIGYSVQNRPLTALWAGSGPRKIAIIGSTGQTQSWATHYQDNPETVPSDMTFWFVPNVNPDNSQLNNFLNANGINIYHNADTRFVNCPDQSSTLDTTAQNNGPYPFSEPESQALRDFLADSWISIFITAETETIQPGGCGLHQPSNTLSAVLAEMTETSISQTTLPANHLVDYLAGQGTAAAIIHSGELDTAPIEALLENADQIMGATTTSAPAFLQWIDPNNSGEWHFPLGTFTHPLALEIIDKTLYILDSGRVYRLDQRAANMPEMVLSPDDNVAGVRVIEPIDLATDRKSLLVLDRAGDIYGYDPETNLWSLHRYDRPISDTSSHYYLALASQSRSNGQHYLLEGSYHFALDQEIGQPDFIWPLPENHQIDISVNNEEVFILSQSPLSKTAELAHYQNGARDNTFIPGLSLVRPRQIQAVGSSVYILDYNGRRLSTVNAITGELDTTYLPADGKPISAFLVDEENGRILLAAQDKLWFFGQPENKAVIQGTGPHSTPQIHDPHLLENLRGLLMPIGGSDIAIRENQMPGAPRHYRLGVHEGADFYWQSGTPVRAVAAGTVIRATLDYQIPSQQLFNSWQTAVQTLGYTSAEAHDFYRGMQVWSNMTAG